MLKEFKENKKAMEIKMEQAAKLADAAADEFIESIKALVKDASEEDVKELVEDSSIDIEDKIAVIAAYTDSHDDIGAAIIGFIK